MFGIVLDFGLTGLFLLLDGIVYWLVSKLFGLYAALAGAEIIKNEFFQQITGRIYVIIGIFMLFVVAYSLLKALVNPDNLAKDTGKIVTNIIISLVLLGVVPIIFEYARNLQNIIVSENVIGKIILDNPEDNVAATGRSISLSILETFLYIPDSEEGYSSNEKTIKLFGKEFELGTSSFTLEDVDGGIITWGQLKEYIRDGADANFMKIGYWAESVHEESNGTTYIMFISTLAGVFLAYVLISFCLDLGIRVVKLAFYQLIAPVPIMMRILPEKKSVFDNWVKASVATFMEVFIRLFIMFLVVWMVKAIFGGDVVALNSNVGAFGTAIIVLGIFAFAKQAPKLIGDVIGVDSGNIKLGIGGKVRGLMGKTGAATLGFVTGAVGGAWTAAVNKAGFAGAAAGLVFGGMNGWKGKGMQFNKQRQDVYTGVLDQKGKAGLFGGRSFFDSKKDDAKKTIEDSYLKSQEKYEEKIEKSKEFNKKYDELYKEQEEKNNKTYQKLYEEFVKGQIRFEENRNSKLKEYKERYSQEKEHFEKEKTDKINHLSLDYEKAKNANDIINMSSIQKQLDSIKNSTYSNTELQVQINQLASSQYHDIELEQKMNDALVVDTDSIKQATKNALMSDNEKYKQTHKYVAQKHAEKEAKKWREEHAEENEKQVAMWEEAMKRANKSPGSIGGPGIGEPKGLSDSKNKSDSSKK